MHLLKTAAVLGVTLALAGCPTDEGDEPVETRLELASQSPATRARLVRAVVQDASIAGFLARELRAHSGCATATADGAADTLTLVSTAACDNGAGGTFQGRITFLGVSGAFPAIRFDDVRFTGSTADDDIAIDGALDFDFDEATQIFTEHAALTMTRAGITLQTTISSENRPGQPILDGAVVTLAGRTAAIRGGLSSGVTLTGVDAYAFTPDADGCGAGAVGAIQEEICLRSTTPSRFTAGALRQVSATCDGDDGALRIETTSDAPLTLWIDGITYRIGANAFDATLGAYVFTASDPGCHGAGARQYAASQAAGVTGSSRSELLVVPRVTWGTASN